MIIVNNKDITEKEFDLACNEFLIKTGKKKLSQNEIVAIANQLIDTLLLTEEAQKEDFSASEEEVSNYLRGLKSNFKTEDGFAEALKGIGYTIDTMKEKIENEIILRKYLDDKFYSKVTIQDNTVKDYYTAHEEHFYSRETINASHILFKKEDKEKAEKIREELIKDKDFAETAKEYSQCPTSKKGGELGSFAQGQMVPEFEQVAFSLEPGEISNLVETQFGYHIIKLNSKEGSKKLEYNEVKNAIKKQMVDKEVNEYLKSTLNTLRENADINIDKNVLESKLRTYQEIL